MQCKIQNEIKEADFVGVIADDTTDASNHFQNVVVFSTLCLVKLLRGSDPSVTCYKVILKLYLLMC